MPQFKRPKSAPRIPHLSAARRRACVERVTAGLGVSERLACRVLGQHRSTQRTAPSGPDDEAALREEIVALARLYGRYGYRRVAALLRVAGWCTNHKRVERIWRGSRHCRERAEGAAAAAEAWPPVAE